MIKIARVLFVVSQQGFQDHEFSDSKKIIEEKHEVKVASLTTEKAVGKFGLEVQPDFSLCDALDQGDCYSAIVFIGGPGTPVLFDNTDALAAAKRFFQDGKIVAAICMAPSILANAGILKGKKATSFSSEEENLKAKGAIYTGENVVIDGKVITANGPGAATEFGKKIVELLG